MCFTLSHGCCCHYSCPVCSTQQLFRHRVLRRSPETLQSKMLLYSQPMGMQETAKAFFFFVIVWIIQRKKLCIPERERERERERAVLVYRSHVFISQLQVHCSKWHSLHRMSQHLSYWTASFAIAIPKRCIVCLVIIKSVAFFRYFRCRATNQSNRNSFVPASHI
jgi:hypothetical protein